MLLFLIGLELELSRLLAMRRDIFGLGVAQLVLTAAAIFGLALLDRTVRLARRAGRGPRAGALSDLDRAAHPGGARPSAAALRPARLRDPAVPGHVGRAAARAGARCSRAGRGAQHSYSLAETAGIGGAHRRRNRRAGARRALSAQSVLPPARLDRRARGDDGRGAAGRARRGAVDAVGRHVDGARRIPRRRAARRIDLSPRTGSRHRAVPRLAARRCSSWASA